MNLSPAVQLRSASCSLAASNFQLRAAHLSGKNRRFRKQLSRRPTGDFARAQLPDLD